MTTASLTFDRTGLSLPDLVVSGTASEAAGLYIGAGGFSEPAFDVRTTYAPESAYVPGTQLLAAVLGASTLPVVVVAKASTTAALAVLKAELAAACYQFDYTLTVTIDGVAQTWDAGPCWPAWGELFAPWVDVHMAKATLVIPVQPTGA